MDFGRHLARLHHRRRACSPTRNTASHDNHEKINSWVSFSFLYESNENGRFSARLGLDKLMFGREIENAVFPENTKKIEERKHMTSLLLLRPTYMQR